MYVQLCVDKNGENVFSIIDLASIAVIIASFAVVVYKIQSELKAKA